MEQTRELQAFRGRNKLIQQLVNRVNLKMLRTLELIKHYWFQSNTSRTLKNYVPQLCYEKIHLSIIQTSEVLPFCLDSLFAFIVFTKQEKSSVKRRWSFHKASFATKCCESDNLLPQEMRTELNMDNGKSKLKDESILKRGSILMSS